MIHVLGEGKDAKGIQLKITYNDVSRETSVVVWHGETVKTSSFPANRFGFHLGDSVKALTLADEMARDVGNEAGL